ncbi:hypothetical protein F4779DRAFT_424531 [Xylariaceae sp. FL0662B]|nr:hypothetical protein F4779DRAFT_424531 [Xylariaceae sp. FL0662B]
MARSFTAEFCRAMVVPGLVLLIHIPNAIHQNLVSTVSSPRVTSTVSWIGFVVSMSVAIGTLFDAWSGRDIQQKDNSGNEPTPSRRLTTQVQVLIEVLLVILSWAEGTVFHTYNLELLRGFALVGFSYSFRCHLHRERQLKGEQGETNGTYGVRERPRERRRRQRERRRQQQQQQQDSSATGSVQSPEWDKMRRQFFYYQLYSKFQARCQDDKMARRLTRALLEHGEEKLMYYLNDRDLLLETIDNGIKAYKELIKKGAWS